MTVTGRWFQSSAVKLVSRTKGPGRLAILIFHRVLPTPDPMRPGEPTVAEFADQMELIRNHFYPLSLSDALDRLAADSLPARAVCVTFDDGYADNEKLALPILKHYGISACVFVATQFLNGGVMWNDRVIEGVRNYSGAEIELGHYGLSSYSVRSAEERLVAAQSILVSIKHRDPTEREKIALHISSLAEQGAPDLMMTTPQLKNLLQAGVEIGAHTHSHPILSSLDLQSSRGEIVRGKAELEKIMGKPVRFFAYPNGRPQIDYSEDHVEIVKALGFEAALSTHWGSADKNTDRFQLPRFTPWDRSPLRYAMRLAHNYRNVR